MKIHLFVPSLSIGGAERQFVQLANGLSERGHALHLVTLHPGGELERILSADVRRSSLFARKGSRLVRPLQFMALRRRWSRLVKDDRPDVVFSALYVGNLIAHRVVGHTGVPLVWGIRGGDQELGRIQRFACDYGRRHAPAIRLAIFNSRSGAEHHEQAGFRFREKLVIPNGIDVERFSRDEEAGASFRRRHGFESGATLVGLVGRLTPVKDHSLFLRAAARVAEARPEARFVCVGGGAPGTLDRLRREARDLGLGAKLVFSGAETDMPGTYSALDLLASTSRGEGFPNVIAEAMACEVPCVVTDVGDSALIVGEHGRVVPPGDEAAQARAWLESSLALPGEARVEVGRAGREHVTTRFGLAACMQRTEAALAEIERTPRPA